jgi:hypothetical protein
MPGSGKRLTGNGGELASFQMKEEMLTAYVLVL